MEAKVWAKTQQNEPAQGWRVAGADHRGGRQPQLYLPSPPPAPGVLPPSSGYDSSLCLLRREVTRPGGAHPAPPPEHSLGDHAHPQGSAHARREHPHLSDFIHEEETGNTIRGELCFLD